MQAEGSISLPTTWTILTTLPEVFHPLIDNYFTITTIENVTIRFWVNTSGVIRMAAIQNTSTTPRGNSLYVLQ